MSEGPVTADSGAAREMGRRHVRGSALLVVGRVASLVIGTATQVLIVRALSKAEYGGFAYALSLAAGARILLSMGQGKALSRFMAGYEEERDFPRMFGAMFLAVGTILLTSTVLIGVLHLFSQELLGGAVDSPAAVRLVLILILLAPMEALDQVFVAMFAVFSEPRAIFFRKYLMAPGLRLVVVVLLIATGADVTFLAVGYVVASAAGLALYAGLLVRALRERGLLAELHPRQVVLPYRAVFAFSLPLISGELVVLSLNVGGVIVLGLYHPVAEVADYRAVFSPARLNTAVTASFVTLFLPMIARLHARGDVDGLRRSYWHTAVFVAVLSFPIFALTGPLAPITAVLLFGERYADSAATLALLALGYYVNVLLGSNAYVLQVCGQVRFLVGVNLLVTALNLGLCLLLAPRYAAAGVAGANAAALVAQNALNQWRLRRTIGTRVVDPECYQAYAAILGGAAVLLAFRVLVDPGAVLAVAAAAVVSVAVLLLSRDAMQLRATFPELEKVPLLGRVLR